MSGQTFSWACNVTPSPSKLTLIQTIAHLSLVLVAAFANWPLVLYFKCYIFLLLFLGFLIFGYGVKGYI